MPHLRPCWCFLFEPGRCSLAPCHIQKCIYLYRLTGPYNRVVQDVVLCGDSATTEFNGETTTAKRQRLSDNGEATTEKQQQRCDNSAATTAQQQRRSKNGTAKTAQQQQRSNKAQQQRRSNSGAAKTAQQQRRSNSGAATTTAQQQRRSTTAQLTLNQGFPYDGFCAHKIKKQGFQDCQGAGV